MKEKSELSEIEIDCKKNFMNYYRNECGSRHFPTVLYPLIRNAPSLRNGSTSGSTEWAENWLRLMEPLSRTARGMLLNFM